MDILINLLKLDANAANAFCALATTRVRHQVTQVVDSSRQVDRPLLQS